MAAGIIIHISIGGERRTEYFATEKIRIGSNSDSDIQITTKQIPVEGLWLELEDTEGVYRVTNFNPNLQFSVNGKPIRRYIAISDGDKIESAAGEMALSFFTLAGQGTLIKTGSSGRHVAQFIEEAALDAAASPRRDEAKAFLREFIRELSREISWTTKLMILVISVGFLTGILYLGYAVNEELKQSRQQAEQQNETIRRLESQLYEATNQLGSLEQTNKDLIRAQSLAQNVRVDYGTGVCLIMGVYDLVERKSGKVLRYADSSALNNPYEPAPEGSPSQPSGFLLTTEGTGSPVEYDFIGTGFHVGNGFIITNRHVLQPWSEDEIVKAMIRDYNGAPRVKWLVAYFPNHSEPYTLKVKGFAAREDIAVAAIETDNFPADIPSLPLDFGSDAATVGKTVVSIGYPSGLDRLLAMVDDEEAKSINRRFGNSRRNLINFLAQTKKIAPLTTQGAITDLDSRRIVHDAKTAEGGSGSPLFGQSGKVIGINFGVFTENTAANMAVPIKYAIEVLKKAGWQSADEKTSAKEKEETNSNTSQPQNTK